MPRDTGYADAGVARFLQGAERLLGGLGYDPRMDPNAARARVLGLQGEELLTQQIGRNRIGEMIATGNVAQAGAEGMRTGLDPSLTAGNILLGQAGGGAPTHAGMTPYFSIYSGKPLAPTDSLTADQQAAVRGEADALAREKAAMQYADETKKAALRGQIATGGAPESVLRALFGPETETQAKGAAFGGLSAEDQRIGVLGQPAYGASDSQVTGRITADAVAANPSAGDVVAGIVQPAPGAGTLAATQGTAGQAVAAGTATPAQQQLAGTMDKSPVPGAPPAGAGSAGATVGFNQLQDIEAILDQKADALFGARVPDADMDAVVSLAATIYQSTKNMDTAVTEALRQTYGAQPQVDRPWIGANRLVRQPAGTATPAAPAPAAPAPATPQPRPPNMSDADLIAQARAAVAAGAPIEAIARRLAEWGITLPMDDQS